MIEWVVFRNARILWAGRIVGGIFRLRILASCLWCCSIAHNSCSDAQRLRCNRPVTHPRGSSAARPLLYIKFMWMMFNYILYTWSGVDVMRLTAHVVALMILHCHNSPNPTLWGCTLTKNATCFEPLSTYMMKMIRPACADCRQPGRSIGLVRGHQMDLRRTTPSTSSLSKCPAQNVCGTPSIDLLLLAFFFSLLLRAAAISEFDRPFRLLYLFFNPLSPTKLQCQRKTTRQRRWMRLWRDHCCCPT